MTLEFGMKQFVRCAAMLAAVIVTTDAFAQTATRSRPNLFNRNRNRPGAAQPAAPGPEGGTATKTENKEIPALNWDAAPVDIVLQAYADQLDKTYLKDPAVPNATITLKSKEGQKMTQEEYLEAIEVILEMNGIHIEPYGEKFLRVLPRKEVRKEGIPIIMDSEQKLADSGKVVSMMVQLKNISTEDGQKTLDNFKSGSGIIIAFERTNSLLITDTEQNINRMLEIVRAIDVAMPVLENVFVRQIKNASAQDIKTALEAIVQESQKELEKSGNKNAANIAQPATPSRFGAGRLLNNQNKPAAPVNNSSVLMQVSDADRGMIRGKVLILADERSNKLVIVTQKPNMDFFDKVIEQLDVETTPDTVVKVYRLKYAEAEEVSDMINDLIGNSGSSRSSGRDNQNRNARNGTGGNMTRSNTALNAQRKSANQRTGEAKAGELTKDNTTVLADERINGLVVMTEKDLVPTIEQIIESMDIKLSQVLIETVILEVSLGDGIETGMDWVQKGRQTVNTPVQDSAGRNMYYTQRTVETTKNGESTGTSTSFINSLVPEGYSKSWSETSTDEEGNSIVQTFTDVASSSAGSLAHVSTDGLANYWTAGTYTALGGGQGGQIASEVAEGVTSNLLGKAFNFIFDSDELGIKGILQATKTDSRSKYIASPVIMTLDNKEATIEATQMKYLFKGYQYSGSTYNGSAVPDYEQKELGITIKVTPKINPNGTVMLTLEEEYSQEGAGQLVDGVNQATTVTRKMSADALLENNQTVIFAGLTETSTIEKETGIPILKDIPWIGKWLFGTVYRNEARTELLVFMTPYVLNDAEAAQAEAIRRKRAISDQHAWDDHGWSASALADPVSKKEQLRRLKDEWKKQDEERSARIAIEQEKIKRVKQLEKMSKEERKKWIEMHKEELEEEEKDKLEEKMLDEDSQEDLKKLAEQIKAKKLKAADAELDKTAKEFEQENEYNRIKRERKEKEAGEIKVEGQEKEKGEVKVEGQDQEKKEEPSPVEPPKPEQPAEPAAPNALNALMNETDAAK